MGMLWRRNLILASMNDIWSDGSRLVEHSLVMTTCLFVMTLAVVATPSVGYAQSEELAINDIKSNVTSGTSVTISVVDNDTPSGFWNPSTVRIVDPSDPTGESLALDLFEDDQGVWIVTAEGAIEFSPCLDINVPTGCARALASDPFPVDYKVLPFGYEVDDVNAPWSNPATVEIYYKDTGLSVTIAYFFASLASDVVKIDWASSLEVGVLGYNLLGLGSSNLERVNESLVPSLAIDSVSMQEYSYSADMDYNLFYLETVTVSGEVSVSGPYDLGRIYGMTPNDNDDSVDSVFLPFVFAH